ncbi:MAG: Y-family DNA polymerase, partial [Bacteroidaceae bacterium]|nr:Y-family DNA polymerase [Bacteroidaceae bacterium]
MYALVDCNSFFCAVEKVFHPGLSSKPVCVLSSNDGCVVALTPEAKALGIRRGDPVFKVKDIVERNDVRVFSGNMRLYAAMSRRIVQILRKSVAKVENYSIDESFCCLDGYERLYDLAEFMRGIARKIALYTDIPVSVGIAPTKTLAKAGSLFAKRYAGYRGVCMIDTEEKRRKALSMLSLADIWGIGRRTREKLSLYGVESPLAFADKSASWVKSHLQKNGYCTWLELNSVPC